MDSPLKTAGNAFERIRHLDGEREWWCDQKLRTVLGYTGANDYQKFQVVVKKAKIAFTRTGFKLDDHFFLTNLPQYIGSINQKMVQVEGYSRFACYLIIQNANPKKNTVALGQLYFAIQTLRMEMLDRTAEDQRRVELRHQIMKWEVKLKEEAKNCGVLSPNDFAAFSNEGYRGLYGGMDIAEVRELRSCGPDETPLDRMGRAELAAHAFRITQTEQKLKRDQIEGKEKANRTHRDVSARIRNTMIDLGNETPENLPTAPNIKLIEIRCKNELGQYSDLFSETSL